VDDDRTLTRRMLSGDEGAFEELFDRFFPGLYRFALARRDGDADAAEEVVQTTASRRPTELWNVGAAWSYHTGWPTTAIRLARDA
jgi:DNA-directed RNA polymerase specialized sigma24 family protein